VPDDDGYTVEDLQRWVDRARANIATLQEGIEAEQRSIAWAEGIIADLKQRQEAAGDGTE